MPERSDAGWDRLLTSWVSPTCGLKPLLPNCLRQAVRKLSAVFDLLQAPFRHFLLLSSGTNTSVQTTAFILWVMHAQEEQVFSKDNLE